MEKALEKKQNEAVGYCDEDMLNEYYEENKEEYEWPEGNEVNHIDVEAWIPEDIEEIRERLKEVEKVSAYN